MLDVLCPWWCQWWRCLPCACSTVPKMHFNFNTAKVGAQNRLFFLIVFIQPSLVSEDWVQEQGTAQSASWLADVCTRLPLWLIPNTSRSFRRVIFYFHFGALLLLLCPPPSRSKMSCQLLFIWWFKCPCLVSFSPLLCFLLPLQRQFYLPFLFPCQQHSSSSLARAVCLCGFSLEVFLC